MRRAFRWDSYPNHTFGGRATVHRIERLRADAMDRACGHREEFHANCGDCLSAIERADAKGEPQQGEQGR